MRPEREAAGKPALGVFQQSRADPAALRVGMDEEVPEMVVGHRREGDDAAVILDDPGLVAGQEPVAHEVAGPLRRVNRWKPRLRGAGGGEHVRDCGGVARGGASEHGP
jgi:hypothetical protein